MSNMHNHTSDEWLYGGVDSLLVCGHDVEFISVETDSEAGGGIALVHNKPHGVGRANAALVIAAPVMLPAIEKASRALFIAAQIARNEEEKSKFLDALQECEKAAAVYAKFAYTKGGAA